MSKLKQTKGANRMSKPKWQAKLTKKDLKHLRETTDRVTLRGFKSNRKYQLKRKREDGLEPCWTCRFIAKKLGLE